MNRMTVEKWIDARQAQGKYTYLRADAVNGSKLSAESVKKALQRLEKKGRVAKAKDYFYVIVPLEYASAGGPPASWFVDDLLAAMKLPYYVGLLSAAALHGASHQQPQEFQVVTNRSVRPVSVGRARVRFFASKFIDKAAVVSLKTPTGAMRVSSPETSVVDLVRFANSAGNLDNVATVISELSPSLDPKKLLAAVRLVNDLPSTQRLGYILDHVGAKRLAAAIHECAERQSPRPVSLRKGRPAVDASENLRWHILVNQPLQVDV